MPITKALISVRGSAGWSATLLFANPEDRFFAHRGPFILGLMANYVLYIDLDLHFNVMDSPHIRTDRQTT